MEAYLNCETDMQHVIIRKAPKGRYAMYGGLTKLPDGEILCVYKVGSLDPKTNSPWTVRDETIVWARSSDRGRSWPETENVIYKDGATRQENCCGKGYRSATGTFMHPFYILNADYEEAARENNWSKMHLAVTRDEGKTWQIRRLEVPLSIAASFGGIVRLKDGALLLNVYGAASRGSFRHEAAVLWSRDEGETWSDYTVIGRNADPDKGPARLNETDIVERPDGGLLAMSRTQYADFPLYRSVSGDGGKTWTTGPSGLTGLCPALCRTAAGPPEGVVAVAYHDRWGRHKDKGGVYVAFSHDHGATWGEPMWISGGAYPCMIEMEPGRVFCSYYQSSVRLCGSFLRIPFPTGLRARADEGGIRLEWDSYTGIKAKDYAYRIYRSAQPGDDMKAEDLVGTVKEANSYFDAGADSDKACYYRVAAFEGETRVNVSWATAATRSPNGQRP